MAAESTQGDTHDKAWKKAEKKFTQYVSMFLPSTLFYVCPFLKRYMTFLKSSVTADVLRGIIFTWTMGSLRATRSNTE